ncbi:MAG: ATP-binding cassette domain-containing protein [Planctomycetota bacterium]|jgi:ATP-binding cassette subfamily F protein uup
MPLLALQDITLGYGGPPLLDQVQLSLEEGERVCLVGRNGTGKSSLMRMVCGQAAPDAGQMRTAPDLRVAYLQQEVPAAAAGTVAELAAVRSLGPPDEEDWAWQIRVDTVFAGLGLTPDARFAELSGGLKRRVFLARALIARPDLLLLDEPTNHLDIRSITWLERYLTTSPGALLFVTHDRAFLQSVATRIVELDRGMLTSFPGDFASYQQRKAAALAAEETERALFDKRLAQEEAWIRQGIKARRTRNEGRVRALKKMRAERAERRERMGNARIQISEAEKSGKMVVVAEDLQFAFDDFPIVRGLTTQIARGDKVGLVGPNGVGKTTLLKLLLGELDPQGGSVELGTRLEVAYLDQLRGTLDEDETVVSNLAEGNDSIFVDGKPRHVISYLKEFLFAPDRARQPVSVLSGGERNRLLLARLFAKPSNLLVLDEPTNDLDSETLELLEERLMDYSGTVLLVSHDRAFLNAVVTSTLVFYGGGRVEEFVGGYDDWVSQRTEDPFAPPKPQEKPREKARKPTPERPRKLKFAEKRELEEIPARIETLDAEIERLREDMASPEFYKKDKDTIAGAIARLEEAEAELEQVYSRWEELDALA